MEHRKYNVSDTYFLPDIINIIDKEVQSLAKERWSDDQCPPKFSVSLNNEDPNNQSIMLTINHLCSNFTWSLFPRNDSLYGYESLLSFMVSMYNRTM